MNEELAFWDAELSLRGPFREFTQKRVDPELRKEEFPGAFFDALVPHLDRSFGSKRPFKCIELGSGPLSNLAYGVDIGLIDVTAVDVLAEEYHRLYKKHGISDYPVKPVPGRGETIAALFEKESFHCAYARNSLDHTRDIVLSFRNLISLVKKNGYIILQHALREGSKNNWSHDHNWDLELTAHGLVAFNEQGEEFELQKDTNLSFALVYYRSMEFDRWVDMVLKKE